MPQQYSLATISRDGDPAKVGLVRNGKVAAIDDLVERLGPAAPKALAGRDMLSLLDDWPETSKAIDALAVASETGADDHFVEIGAVHFLPPINLPRQVFCTGANYRTHVIDLMVDMEIGPEGMDRAERRAYATEIMDRRAVEGTPLAFQKPISAIAGPNDDLALPPLDDKPDWELELAVVIGQGGWQISRDNAMDHIAGYAIVNDVTSRTLIPRVDDNTLGLDWLRSKGQPGYLPFGPWILPARFVDDPKQLHLQLRLNGNVMQNEDASDMIFDIAQQIEHISRYAKIYPGDIICTGSPAGNGTHHGRFLQPGDVMEGEITGLGRQVVRCVSR